MLAELADFTSTHIMSVVHIEAIRSPWNSKKKFIGYRNYFLPLVKNYTQTMTHENYMSSLTVDTAHSLVRALVHSRLD